MLDTIRQFGADHLAGTNAEAVRQRRLVAHYLAMAQRWGRDPMRDQLAQFRGSPASTPTCGRPWSTRST